MTRDVSSREKNSFFQADTVASVDDPVADRDLGSVAVVTSATMFVTIAVHCRHKQNNFYELVACP